MATVGEPTEHGSAERLMRTLKEEAVTRHDDTDLHAGYHRRGRVLAHVSQPKRMHAALGYRTPAAVETPGLEPQSAVAAVTFATPSTGPNSWGHYNL